MRGLGTLYCSERRHVEKCLSQFWPLQLLHMSESCHGPTCAALRPRCCYPLTLESIALAHSLPSQIMRHKRPARARASLRRLEPTIHKHHLLSPARPLHSSCPCLRSVVSRCGGVSCVLCEHGFSRRRVPAATVVA